jgi:hypothetical protein
MVQTSGSLPFCFFTRGVAGQSSDESSKHAEEKNQPLLTFCVSDWLLKTRKKPG